MSSVSLCGAGLFCFWVWRVGDKKRNERNRPYRSIWRRSVPGVPGIGMYKFGVVALGKVERKEPSLPFRFDRGRGKKI